MRIILISLISISIIFGISENTAPITIDNNIGVVKIEKDESAVPQKMNIQGYLTTAAGDTFTATRSMTFRIYQGGTVVWVESLSTVNIQKGLFSVTLPISLSVFESGTTPCSLQVNVGNQPLSPKVEITSVGYAFKSIKSDTASYAAQISRPISPQIQTNEIADGAITNPKLGDNSVTSNKIQNNQVQNAHIINNAVSTTKIQDSAVTMAKINSSGSTLGQVITSTGTLTPPIWSNPTPGPHTHLGETWSTINNDRGLTTVIVRNSASSVCGKLDSVYQSGTGNAYGGYFCATGTGTGDKYGVEGISYNLSGTDEWAAGVAGITYEGGSNGSAGGFFEADGSGTAWRAAVDAHADVPAGGTADVDGIEVMVTNRGSGTGYGGYFDVDRGSAGTGAAFGVHADALSSTSYHVRGVDGSAYNNGSGPAYGGYFIGGGSGGGTKYGIYSEVGGSGSTRYAGYFQGNVHITGSLTKGSGSFLIDHPLDPLNKTLRHNFVESPENLCLYRGKVKLSSNGEGKVTMPDYFIALTKETEATVTISVIGRPFNTGYEWNNDYSQFAVYGEANREVSYIVLADRDDAVMRELRRPVEEEKGNGNFEKGKLLYPEAYGYPKEMGNDYHPEPEAPRSSNGHKPE